MKVAAVRGMHDLYGADLFAWTRVENRLKEILAGFGYAEIRTPTLEQLEVFKDTVGDDTDIVEKQMYTIEKETETLCLRPEGTAGFMRAVIEHQLHRLPDTQRYFYYQPMFRHERPQKGRLRQFHQFGAEIINDPSPEADAELISLLDQIYKDFGIHEYEVRINSVGCSKCRPVYKENLKVFLKPNFAELCEQCQKRFERNVLRVLDCKKEKCQKLAQGAPVITECLCEDCAKHHSQTLKRLKDAKVTFINDPNIVRGLDYYSRTAFEFTSNLLGAQSALGGGGRYDGLSTRFGEAAFPAVGFGLGMERLIIALEQKGALQKKVPSPLVFLAPLGTDAYEKLFPLSIDLKRKGIWAEMSFDSSKSLKALLKIANRMNAAYTLVLGDDELRAGNFLLKDMKTGNQTQLPLTELSENLVKIHLAENKKE